MLFARQQQAGAQRSLHWLDLMAGCGIRGLRWALEAVGTGPLKPQLLVNDADPDRLSLLRSNLTDTPAAVRISTEPAERLLLRCVLDGHRFDLIDLDAFGSPSALIQPVLKALRFNGLLLLASTDGRSPTGHDRVGAVRNLGAAARAHPASWELALRLQIGLVARQAWMLGFGIQPLMSYSDGRTFRVCLQLQRQIPRDTEFNLGLMARCERCGSQAVQPLLKLKTWPECRCADRSGQWCVSGPLWIGALQDQVTLDALLCDAINLGATLISRQTLRLLRRFRADPGVPATVWATAELARRIGCSGPPALDPLVSALRKAGHQAYASGVMAGQVRSDADLPELLQICSSLRPPAI